MVSYIVISNEGKMLGERLFRIAVKGEEPVDPVESNEANREVECSLDYRETKSNNSRTHLKL